MVVGKDDLDRFIFRLAVEAGLDQRLALGVVVNFVAIENYIQERRVSVKIDCGRQSVAPINCCVARALLNDLLINQSWQVRRLVVVGYINSEFSKLGCVNICYVSLEIRVCLQQNGFVRFQPGNSCILSFYPKFIALEVGDPVRIAL